MENRYVLFNKPFMHYQISKFNGTSGQVLIDTDNVGILSNGKYIFKIINGVIPEINEGLLKPHRSACRPDKGPLVSFFDSNINALQDSDEQSLIERFELRLLKAQSNIDITWAKLAFAAGQVNRLSIKASILKLKLS